MTRTHQEIKELLQTRARGDQAALDKVMQMREWKAGLNRFAIVYENRLPLD